MSTLNTYRHFKGNLYNLICFAKHSETGEQLVIYTDVNGNIFARPHNLFFGEIEYNGQLIPRFTKINEADS